MCFDCLESLSASHPGVIQLVDVDLRHRCSGLTLVLHVITNAPCLLYVVGNRVEWFALDWVRGTLYAFSGCSVPALSSCFFNNGGGGSPVVSTCLMTVVGGKHGYVPCEILLLQQIPFSLCQSNTLIDR